MAISRVDGAAELRAALNELKNMQSSDWKSTLKSAVRTPMTAVKKQAAQNLSAISPGKTEIHKTYLGRMVTAGFAARNLKLKVKLMPTKGMVTAVLGVVKEAFYVLSFFELGTAYIMRHPWLTPAMEMSKDRIIKDVADAMRKRIDAIAKKRYASFSGGKK